MSEKEELDLKAFLKEYINILGNLDRRVTSIEEMLKRCRIVGEEIKCEPAEKEAVEESGPEPETAPTTPTGPSET